MPVENPIPRCALLLRTIELLRHRPRALTLETIRKDTNLSIRWLSNLISDDFGSPSVCRVVKLYEYLSNKTLNVE